MSEFVDGRLDAAREAQLHEHVAECRACADELQALRETMALLHEVEQLDPPSNLVAEVRARIEEEQTQPAWAFLGRPQFRAALAACVVLALCIWSINYLQSPTDMVQSTKLTEETAPRSTAPIAETAPAMEPAPLAKPATAKATKTLLAQEPSSSVEMEEPLIMDELADTAELDTSNAESRERLAKGHAPEQKAKHRAMARREDGLWTAPERAEARAGLSFGAEGTRPAPPAAPAPAPTREAAVRKRAIKDEDMVRGVRAAGKAALGVTGGVQARDELLGIIAKAAGLRLPPSPGPASAGPTSPARGEVVDAEEEPSAALYLQSRAVGNVLYVTVPAKRADDVLQALKDLQHVRVVNVDSDTDSDFVELAIVRN